MWRSLTFRFAETKIVKHKTTSVFGVFCAFSVSLWQRLFEAEDHALTNTTNELSKPMIDCLKV